MIDDWDYQRQLKKGQIDEVDAREHTDAINGMQVNQAALDQEALKGENKNKVFFLSHLFGQIWHECNGKHFLILRKKMIRI